MDVFWPFLVCFFCFFFIVFSDVFGGVFPANLVQSGQSGGIFRKSKVFFDGWFSVVASAALFDRFFLCFSCVVLSFPGGSWWFYFFLMVWGAFSTGLKRYVL